jgi:hypothetical protein
VFFQITALPLARLLAARRRAYSAPATL